MPTTGVLGGPDSLLGNIVLGEGAAVDVPPEPPPPPPPVVPPPITAPFGARIPALQITLTLGASTRILNGAGSNAAAENISWSNVVNGGHVDCRFTVLDSERVTNSGIYRYGTRCEVAIAPGEPHAGTKLFTGYLLTPVTEVDGARCELVAQGYQQLLRERTDPLLWQTYHAKDWADTDDPPFAPAFDNADAINMSIGNATIEWSVSQGQAISAGDTTRAGFYVDDDVNITRVAGTIHKRVGTSQYAFKLIRYDGPGNPQTGQTVNNFATELSSTNNVETFQFALGVPKPVATLELSRVGSISPTGAAYKLRVNALRVNGDAAQSGRGIGDSYAAYKPILDMCDLIGFTTARVSTASTSDCLPLWNQANTAWSDTLDHIAMILTGAQGFKWAVWDFVGAGPEMEARDYATGNKTWTTKGYTAQATSICQLDSITNDMYSKVSVTFRRLHSRRLARVSVPVSPNPFAGLDPPLSGRSRVKN
jgi:hypothetical protein